MRILTIEKGPNALRINSKGKVYEKNGSPCIIAVCPICKEKFWARIRYRKSNSKNHQIFCSRDCFYKSPNYKPPNRKGKENNFWKGGRFIDSHGYVLILDHKHPYSNNSGYIREHRLMAEKALGRYLKRNEQVHHINGKKSDNRNCNFLIYSISYHNWLEAKMANLYKKEHFGGEN